MNIIINGESINYTLEGERKAGEIFEGLCDWLADSGLLVSTIHIDGRPVSLGRKDWLELPLDNIGTFDLKAVSYRESRIGQLKIARDYFSLLAGQSGDASLMQSLGDGYTDLQPILPQLLEEGNNPVIVPRMERVLSEAGFPPGISQIPLSPETISAEAGLMADLLEERLREVLEPEETARKAITELKQMRESFNQVAVQLQTGMGSAAMEVFMHLTEIFQTLLRALFWTETEDMIESLIENLRKILSELEGALANGDTVLIGDLLEYEITPWIGKFSENIPDEWGKS